MSEENKDKLNWADDGRESPSDLTAKEPDATESATATATETETETATETAATTETAEDSNATEELAQELKKKLELDVSTAPDLHSGELLVRQAGKEEFGQCDVEKVTSFSALDIDESIKKAVTSVKGWDTMSKIQQIGLPLILSNPPMNLIGQAQAGTGKTGTFVISALARITAEEAPSQPQAIIVATTQELVTQIASEVDALGQFKGIKARRVMSARSKDGTIIDAPWMIPRGGDFMEQVVVGTSGMVKNYLQNCSGRRIRKPCIDACNVKVLVLDEADQLIAYPPHGSGEDLAEIRRLVLMKRGEDVCQILLFSATFHEEVKYLAREFVGQDKEKYHEITLRKEDTTLDKVVNFFVLVKSHPGEHFEDMYEKKYRAILEIWASLADYNLGQTVIFVNRKDRARNLAEFLRKEGYDVGQIHGDMAKDERERVFAEFKEGKRPALVATNILSRGIDNPNVTLVINVDLPQKHSLSRSDRDVYPDPECFVHRIGRSGRWTKKGASVSLISAAPEQPDLKILQDIERALFVTPDGGVNRPMIMVPDASKLGEYLAKNLTAIQ